MATGLQANDGIIKEVSFIIKRRKCANLACEFYGMISDPGAAKTLAWPRGRRGGSAGEGGRGGGRGGGRASAAGGPGGRDGRGGATAPASTKKIRKNNLFEKN